MGFFTEMNKEVEEMNKEMNEKNENTTTAGSEIENNPDLIVEQPKKRGRPAKVQNEIFVEMWNNALKNGSLQEVAASLGISPASCSVKASNLRKAGLDLPQFKRGRRKKAE